MNTLSTPWSEKLIKSVKIRPLLAQLSSTRQIIQILKVRTFCRIHNVYLYLGFIIGFIIEFIIEFIIVFITEFIRGFMIEFMIGFMGILVPKLTLRPFLTLSVRNGQNLQSYLF